MAQMTGEFPRVPRPVGSRRARATPWTVRCSSRSSAAASSSPRSSRSFWRRNRYDAARRSDGSGRTPARHDRIQRRARRSATATDRSGIVAREGSCTRSRRLRRSRDRSSRRRSLQRDSLSNAVSDLDALLARVEGAPVTASYRALAEIAATGVEPARPRAARFVGRSRAGARGVRNDGRRRPGVSRAHVDGHGDRAGHPIRRPGPARRHSPTDRGSQRADSATNSRPNDSHRHRGLGGGAGFGAFAGRAGDPRARRRAREGAATSIKRPHGRGKLATPGPRRPRCSPRH